jgi:hypothetical protein
MTSQCKEGGGVKDFFDNSTKTKFIKRDVKRVERDVQKLRDVIYG